MFEPLKTVTTIIHPNREIRTYGVGYIFPMKEGEDYDSFCRSGKDYPEPTQSVINTLLSRPYVDRLSINRGDIRVEPTEAYKDRWDLTNDDIVEILRNGFYSPEDEVELRVRDDAAAAEEYRSGRGRDEDED